MIASTRRAAASSCLNCQLLRFARSTTTSPRPRHSLRVSSSRHLAQAPMNPKAVASASAPPPEHAAYPRLSPEDVAPPPPLVVPPAGANPYVLSAASPNPPAKSVCENLREMFDSVGKKFSEAARRTEDIAGDVWQHLKTGPSFTDAAMGRIAQISKVICEGGYDKIFQQTFECLPDEKLKKAYVCYLSTTHGPIVGVLYISTVKVAFGSDNPVTYVTEDNRTASSFYKFFFRLRW